MRSLLIALCGLGLPRLAAASELVITLNSVHSDLGVVIVALYSAPDGYPLNLGKAARIVTVPVSGGDARATFTGLPFGTYAIAAIHDENKNGTLDTNWLGIPREGVGASNNAHGRFGPPEFADAAFGFDTEGQVFPVKMAYIGD